MTRSDWKARALAALPSIGNSEFTAPNLAHIIRRFENPEHQAIRKADQTAQPRTFHWLAAVRQWEKDNPGCSASNMRRLCELLTAEGVLETRLEKRGWFERRFYSVKGGAQ